MKNKFLGYLLLENGNSKNINDYLPVLVSINSEYLKLEFHPISATSPILKYYKKIKILSFYEEILNQKLPIGLGVSPLINLSFDSTFNENQSCKLEYLLANINNINRLHFDESAFKPTISPIGVLELLSKNKFIKNISIHFNHDKISTHYYGFEHTKIFSIINKNKNYLENLYLSIFMNITKSNNLLPYNKKPMYEIILEEISKCTNLKNVFLFTNNFSEIKLNIFKSYLNNILTNNKNLRRLQLPNAIFPKETPNIKNQGLIHYNVLRQFIYIIVNSASNKLTDIDLSHNRLNIGHIKVIKELIIHLKFMRKIKLFSDFKKNSTDNKEKKLLYDYEKEINKNLPSNIFTHNLIGSIKNIKGIPKCKFKFNKF